jgi:hypothetical protein
MLHDRLVPDINNKDDLRLCGSYVCEVLFGPDAQVRAARTSPRNEIRRYLPDLQLIGCEVFRRKLAVIFGEFIDNAPELGI